MARLKKIKYKDFVFPNNPETTGMKCDRSYVKHKYPELAGNELEDFGADAIVISGSGCFFGDDAYDTYHELYDAFRSKGVGSVRHPIFTEITRGLMVKLEAQLEPRSDYITYSFEIIADTKPNITENIAVYQVTTPTTPTATPATPSADANTGSEVYTVVKGDCLSVICARYSKQKGKQISWKTIAGLNGLKNPNLIYPGQQITISW